MFPPHDYDNDITTNRCRVCGWGQHCSECGEGHGATTSHLVHDTKGWFFKCRAPKRWAKERQRRARKRTLTASVSLRSP